MSLAQARSLVRHPPIPTDVDTGRAQTRASRAPAEDPPAMRRECGHASVPRHICALPGECANLAMLDGAELGKALVKHGADVDAAVREYGRATFPHNEMSALASLDGLEPRCSRTSRAPRARRS